MPLQFCNLQKNLESRGVGLGIGCRFLYPRHTVCSGNSHDSGLFLIKELSDWLQGFIKLSMRRIPFLTPKSGQAVKTYV